jgi:hypothetical protein
MLSVQHGMSQQAILKTVIRVLQKFEFFIQQLG